ncbi:Uncharacterized protein FKW44_024325 [Caligus rogercresseyi]|uniref:Uncharacterized protein n=1 Tax=Caligus rogercresseyi TaxID=217165 RepID=A0A7T8JTT1_CALRO|nr:Uncharacterized protein FKW44_024707 [Caligus rogercresseyi]QQP33081.1 Uncharacterized protein FKW44_024325 [Caligus rogercresseyi]
MASARRSCRNNLDVFCYICGEYTLSGDRKNITGFVKGAYMAYFKSSWVTKISPGNCTRCARRAWNTSGGGRRARKLH